MKIELYEEIGDVSLLMILEAGNQLVVLRNLQSQYQNLWGEIPANQ
jgi:hypothetical protein